MSDIRVVVAEDEAIIRMDLVEVLREEGYDVVADTGRGDDAVALVMEHGPDLALLDVKMPGMTGIEAAREITSSSDTAVVMLTAFSQRELIHEASDAGAMAYLVKPYQREELVPAVELAIARRREAAALRSELDAAEQRFEERKTIDRAKGKLIDEHGLSERDAFTFLQRSAMSTRRRMIDVAHQVLAGDARPSEGRVRVARNGDRDAHRWKLAHLSSLLCLAHRHGHRVGTGDQRRVRLHVDAHQPDEGSRTRPHRRRVRSARADLPARDDTHLQGAAGSSAGHSSSADGRRARGARCDGDPDAGKGRLRSR